MPSNLNKLKNKKTYNSKLSYELTGEDLYEIIEFLGKAVDARVFKALKTFNVPRHAKLSGELVKQLIDLLPCPTDALNIIKNKPRYGTPYEFLLTGIDVKIIIDSLETSCGTPPIDPAHLALAFSDITALGFDYTDVAEWNSLYFWDFTAVTINGNTAYLTGGSVGALEIPVSAFENSLDIRVVDDPGGFIVTVAANAFTNSSLEVAQLDSATSIGFLAFAGSILSTVSVTSAVTIGESSFTSTGISSFNGPAVTEVGRDAFSGCYALIDVQLPVCLTLRDSAFALCTALVSYDMSSVTLIEWAVFSGCDALEDINFASAVTIGDSAFLTTPGTATSRIQLPACTSLGSTVGDDTVFNGRTGATIDATFNVVLATIDGGAEDGDIVYLDTNNTVSITYI